MDCYSMKTKWGYKTFYEVSLNLFHTMNTTWEDVQANTSKRKTNKKRKEMEERL